MSIYNKKTTQVGFIKPIKNIVKAVRENNLVSADELGCSKEELLFAHEVIDAEAYVASFKKDGGKYLCARLRPGFIGNKINLSNGVNYIQSERGKPYGSIVAIPNDRRTVSIGLSYLKYEPKNNPYAVIGLVRALREAIVARDTGMDISYSHYYVCPEASQQIDYFKKRALAYFYPEVYSYSRGQDEKKVIYDNYDEIQSRRKMILGETKSIKKSN